MPCAFHSYAQMRLIYLPCSVHNAIEGISIQCKKTRCPELAINLMEQNGPLNPAQLWVELLMLDVALESKGPHSAPDHCCIITQSPKFQSNRGMSHISSQLVELD